MARRESVARKTSRFPSDRGFLTTVSNREFLKSRHGIDWTTKGTDKESKGSDHAESQCRRQSWLSPALLPQTKGAGCRNGSTEAPCQLRSS